MNVFLFGPLVLWALCQSFFLKIATFYGSFKVYIDQFTLNFKGYSWILMNVWDTLSFTWLCMLPVNKHCARCSELSVISSVSFPTQTFNPSFWWKCVENITGINRFSALCIYMFTKNLLLSEVSGQLTPWSRVCPEKLVGPQVVEKFLALYRTWKFITTFTNTRHMPLSCSRSVQSRYILILFHQCWGLPSSTFPSCVRRVMYGTKLWPLWWTLGKFI
jgi:hypothetical protein